MMKIPEYLSNTKDFFLSPVFVAFHILAAPEAERPSVRTAHDAVLVYPEVFGAAFGLTFWAFYCILFLPTFGVYTHKSYERFGLGYPLSQ